MKFSLGALPSPTDPRDQWGKAQDRALALQTTGIIDLTKTGLTPPIWDQGAEGSCTGQAVARVVSILRPGFKASRRDPYWQGRNLIGMGNGPDGAHVRSLLKCLQRFGTLDAQRAPYLPGQPWAPPPDADLHRKACHAGSYWRINLELRHIAANLQTRGPIVLVVEVDSAFANNQDGILEKPGVETFGLHAIVIAGVDLDRGLVLVENSWGLSWGDHGRAWVSIGWLLLRARELWGLSLSDSPEPSTRPFWEMLLPGVFLDASSGGGSVA